MTDQQLPSDDHTPAEPAMELLGGDAAAAETVRPSLMLKVLRGAVFGMVLLTASALLAVSAVPELGRYVTFGSAGESASCPLSSSACTTLDKVSFDSPCCATKDAASAEGSGCCPLSAAACTETVAATDEGAAGSCCATLSRASLLKASEEKSACCESGEKCCPAAEAVAAAEPIDAGSLLAVAPEQQPLAEPSAGQGAELTADDGQAEE
jgi:hypothetical protein